MVPTVDFCALLSPDQFRPCDGSSEPSASVTLPALFSSFYWLRPDDDNGLPQLFLPRHPCPNHNPASFSVDFLLSYRRYHPKIRSLPRGKRSSPHRSTGNQAKRARRSSRHPLILRALRKEMEGNCGHADSANTHATREPLTNSGVDWGRIRLRTKCSKSFCHALANCAYLLPNEKS